jgi:hypothetical protein
MSTSPDSNEQPPAASVTPGTVENHVKAGDAEAATAKAGVHTLPFDLQGGEHVVFFTRRHWVFLWPRLAFHALIALVPVIILLIVVTWGSLLWKILGIVELAWLVYWGARCFFDWYSFDNDIWVVTNQRIIDAVKPNFFKSRLASADLVDLEDIAVEHEGVLPTVFKFGSLRCQTAGEKANFTLSGVPKPTSILGIIDAARDSARRETRAGWR